MGCFGLPAHGRSDGAAVQHDLVVLGCKCVVFLPDGARGGFQLSGYDDREAIVVVLYRQRRISRAHDQGVAITPIPGGERSRSTPRTKWPTCSA
jgi:hypothetical protein